MTQPKFTDQIYNYLYNHNLTVQDFADVLGFTVCTVYLKLNSNTFTKCERLYIEYWLKSGRKLSKRVLTPIECKSLKKQAKTRQTRLADIADELRITRQSLTTRLRTGKFKVSEIYYLKCVLKFEI